MRVETLDDGSVRIHFDEPILHHLEPRRFLTLRPPTVDDVLELGDPATFIIAAGGAGASVPDRDVLRRYVPRLLVDHDIAFIGKSRDVAIGIAIEETILGFFTAARKRLRPLPAPSSEAAPHLSTSGA